ncbi:MAG TPA: oligosaccharide flippase family protein [Verrucomicrobiae bacterium]|nr:oligosaccharide flippase family protein [Verrucomicrobiae bacterium]
MLWKLRSQWRGPSPTVLFAISNVTVSACALAGALVCAKLLAPQEMGAFQTAMLLVTYLGFLPFGVVNGFNRQYPFLLGKGDEASADLFARNGYSVSRVMGVVAAAVATGQAIWFKQTTSDTVLFVAALSVIPVAALSQVGAIQNAIVTGRHLFLLAAKAQFSLAIVTLGLLSLVWQFGASGQAVRLVVLAAVPWIIYSSATRSARTWHWDWRILFDLIKRGFPILAIGYAYQVFSVADRTLVAKVLGLEAVGHYALAGIAIVAIQSVYTPLAVATYSKANHAFGKSPQWSVLVAPAKRLVVLVTVTVLPLATTIYFALPSLVSWLLPDYSDGIRAGQIACVASVAFCYCGTSFVFNVTGHNWVYGSLVSGALVVFFAVGFMIPKSDLSLELVATIRTIVTIILCVLTNAYVLFYLMRGIKQERGMR